MIRFTEDQLREMADDVARFSSTKFHAEVASMLRQADDDAKFRQSCMNATRTPKEQTK